MVLLVEDHEEHRKIYRRRLERAGIPDDEIVDAETVTEARSALERTPGCEVVVLDLQLPERDEGLELLAWMRASSEQIREVRVVVLSVRSDAEAMRKARELGVVEFFVKPVAADELCAAVLRCRESSRPTPSMKQDRDLRPMKGEV